MKYFTETGILRWYKAGGLKAEPRRGGMGTPFIQTRMILAHMALSVPLSAGRSARRRIKHVTRSACG